MSGVGANLTPMKSALAMFRRGAEALQYAMRDLARRESPMFFFG